MQHQVFEFSDFIQRAKLEARRYGSDPFVFVRELVQNSRDAGASQIRFTAKEDGRCLIVSCQDDGCGMSDQDLNNYLLRLYASSKETDPNAVGFFGVGFWSILSFDPDEIHIDTFCEGVGHALLIDCRANALREMPSELNSPGTRITLVRTANRSLGELKQELLRWLTYYAGPIRPYQSDSISLSLDGTVIGQAFPQAAMHVERFETDNFDGILGFSEEPRVCIYKGGILIREVRTLQEVIPSRKMAADIEVGGFYPEVALNLENAQVLMNRDKIYEDRALEDALDFLEKRVAFHRRKILKDGLPISLGNRLRYYATKISFKPLAAVLGLNFGLWLLFAFLQWGQVSGVNGSDDQGAWGNTSRETTPYLDEVFDRPWRGVDIQPQMGLSDWAFKHDGEGLYLFRLETFGRLDQMRGYGPKLVPVYEAKTTPFLDQNFIGVEMRLRGSDQFILPAPLGYAPVPGTVLVNGRQVPLYHNLYGEYAIKPAKTGVLTYSLGKVEPPPPPPDALQIPFRYPWPDGYRAVIRRARDLRNNGLAVTLITRFLTQRLTYQTGQNFDRSRSWIESTLAIGGGDCDVLNGLLTRMLREAGVPAYLSVGLMSQGDGAAPALHAWTRVFENGQWYVVDLTRMVPDLSTRPFNNPAPLRVPDDTGRLSQDVQDDAISSEHRRAWWVGGFLVLGGLILFVAMSRRKPKAMDERYDPLASELLYEYLKNPGSKDPFQIAYRSIFQTYHHGAVNLVDLERYGRQGYMVALPAKSPFLKYIHPKTLALVDGLCTDVLSSHFPNILGHSLLEELLLPKALPSSIKHMETLLRRFDPELRLYVLNNRFHDTYQEWARMIPLRFNDSDMGSRHFLFYENGPLYLDLMANHDSLEIMAATFLERVPYYRKQAQAWINELLLVEAV